MNRKEFLNLNKTAEFGSICTAIDEVHPITGKDQWGGNVRNYDEVESAEWRIELPHSCDEWVIGSVEDAKEFLRDLSTAITYCETHPIIIE